MEAAGSGFNIADLAVIIIIGVCIAISAKKGLIKSFIGIGYKIVSLILSRLLYPIITKILISTAFYENLKQGVIEKLNLGGIISDQTQKFEADMINSLNLPQMLKTGLLENNNSVAYNFLNVHSIEEYIGGYISMIIINIISIIAVYLIISLILKYGFGTLNIFSRLPVVRTANKIGGGIIGLFQGILIVWIIMAVITLFLSQGDFAYIAYSIKSSLIAVKLYETDIILNMINKIII